MSEMDEGLSSRRRRVVYRCWHCGLRELDVFLGSFAEAHLQRMSEAELAAFETLLAAESPDLLDWLTGAQPVPLAFQGPLVEELKRFRLQKM